MTSSTKPETTLPEEARAMAAGNKHQKLGEIWNAVPEICETTNRQTKDKHTHTLIAATHSQAE